ncbi:MAG: acetylxylan esterase [Bifidobacteriaceae bacterium]|jgi:cephalosporin-C deacetylase|nr:acetylxylan esterase [Bifidobacteriaceae bacterium]
MFQDQPLDQLREYRGGVTMPSDFEAFWRETIDASRARGWAPRLEPVDAGLATLDVYDLTFAGFDGEPIKGWVRAPHGAVGPLPAIVSYVGYGGGRGTPVENLLWASAGFAHILMDARGQGSTWGSGDTPDSGVFGPSAPGVCTRGIEHNSTYYYRRLFTDAALAVSAARELPLVDRDRVGVQGASQGGAMALAAAYLADDVRAAWAGVPFLSDIRHGATITDAAPYREFAQYSACHRDRVDSIFAVTSYFDGVNFARLAKPPVFMTAGLRDDVVPPSTVFAAYNNYAGPKGIRVWEFNGHEGGGPLDDALALRFFGDHLAAA